MTALYEGIRWDWQSFSEYLDALDRMPRALDIGVQVPHAAMRAYVMGERAQDDATAEDLTEMGSLLAAALETGALPAGAGRLVQRSDGYAATMVGGEVVVDDGEPTDARPGRVVRSSRASPV